MQTEKTRQRIKKWQRAGLKINFGKLENKYPAPNLTFEAIKKERQKKLIKKNQIKRKA